MSTQFYKKVQARTCVRIDNELMLFTDLEARWFVLQNVIYVTYIPQYATVVKTGRMLWTKLGKHWDLLDSCTPFTKNKIICRIRG